ncbi:MAG: AsmA family protein [Nitrospirota bacterium]|nr:AsmA family protein [Nitrospirota bacterium]
MLSSRKKICKLISLVLAAIIFLSIIFAYIFYLDIKKTFIARVSGKATSLIGQRVVIGDISFSLPLGIHLKDIQIQNPEGFGAGRLLRLQGLSVEMNYRELLEGKLHIRKIGLHSPELTLMKDREGRLNISDGLKEFLSKKGTLNYQVDEVRVISGMTDFNNDIRLRNEKINLILKNLSSSPRTKTVIEGDTLWSGENRVRFNGWANLKDDPKKFRISVSADDFRFSPFRVMEEKYHIDVERTRARLALDAEGDTEKGVHLVTGIRIKSPGYGIYKKALLDISMNAAAFYNIAEGSATINTFSLKAGESTALKAEGLMRDLQGTLSYDFKVNIDAIDLSAFNILKGVRTSGMLTSDTINIKGRLDDSLPEVSGAVQLRDASVKADAAEVRSMNARIRFSSGKESTVKAEGAAVIVNAGGYALAKPSEISLSLNAKMKGREVTFSSSLTTLPIDMQIGEEKVSLKDARVLTDGILRGKKFSGKSSFSTNGMQYAGYYFKNMRGAFELEYEKNILKIREAKVETEDFSSSAEMITIDAAGRKDTFSIEANNLSAVYPAKKSGINGLDFSAFLRGSGKDFSGDFQFSTAGAKYQEIKSGKIAGRGAFNKKEFSLEIPQADIAGGRIRLTAQGKTSQGLFPVQAEAAAEHIDLEKISPAIEKYTKTAYRLSGNLENAHLKGTIASKESLHGDMTLDLQKFSVLKSTTERYLLRDASVQSEVKFKGPDCEIKAAASAGNVAASISGTARKFMGEEREVFLQGQLPEIHAAEIRNSFWDSFPDALLYAGMEGAVAADLRVVYKKEVFTLGGELRLKDFSIEGENGEYSAGPVNGVIPFAYGTLEDKGSPIKLPSFERSEFDTVSGYYAGEFPADGYNKITIGSVHYGFRLLDDITVWIKQDKGVLNVGRFSANIFGGRLNGSASVDIADGLRYRAGMILEGVSLTSLCDDIEPIRGYISGKVDGIGMVKGSGAGLPQLIGRADFWTYRGRDEKTRISREFLRKIGGPSIKSYLGDRDFDKGEMSLYMQKGYFIFRELEISNRNIFGIQDLSVKVAPYSNRISIDHLLWTIVEAAQRAKKN